MPEALECIVLDFDGTFTDVEREAVPFLETYRRGLEELVGAPIEEPWRQAVARVRAAPNAHGFEYEGRIVAPSHADPYILATTVAHLVLEEAGGAPNGRARAGALEDLFRQSYGTSTTAFRPDAKEVLERVLALGPPVFVVSNSHSEHVEAKLRTLDPGALSRLQIRGNARKFHLVEPQTPDPRFDAVAESMRVEGLERPLYLRRGLYFDALRAIWDRTGARPERTLVCGDIFELDLAMPSQLGARVHLVARPDTPPYERQAVASVGGTSSTALSGLLESVR